MGAYQHDTSSNIFYGCHIIDRLIGASNNRGEEMSKLLVLYKSAVTGKAMERIFWEMEFIDRFGWQAGPKMVDEAVKLGSLIIVVAEVK